MNGGNKELYICSKDDIVQRAAVLLKDVEYVIEAHFDMSAQANDSDNPGKFKRYYYAKTAAGRMLSYTIFGVPGISC